MQGQQQQLYCTVEELEGRLSASVLSQHVPEVSTERVRILTGYITRASARIDMQLSVRFNVPVVPSPLLADICLTICIWQIEADRGGYTDDMPARAQVPYDEAMKALAAIATGGALLPGADTSPAAAAGLVVESPRSLFGESSPGMESF